MEIDQTSPSYLAAARDFRRARQRAVLEQIVAQLTGKSADLLAYEEVLQELRTGEAVARGLQEIPLEAIVGSMGRYADFTRSFLPRRAGDEQRWARVKAAITQAPDIPPIVVYQLGQVYFVLDGNHRVSVARELGLSHIPAYVTEVKTNIPLTPDIQPDELIYKARYAAFLEETHLNELRPQADLSVTAPGQYRVLKAQIDIHRDWLRRQRGQEVAYREAVAHWYDEVYRPVIKIIRERGILRHFPGRTETDLYVWIFQHQAELKAALGWEVAPESAARDLVTRFSSHPRHIIARLKEKVLHALIPDPLEAGPPPGQWRQEQLPTHPDEHLFLDILGVMPVHNKEMGWQVLDQAQVVAQREGGRLHGLHVAPAVAPLSPVQIEAMRTEFQQRCQAAAIPGELSFESGQLIRQVCRRACWSDLIVVDPWPAAGSKPGRQFKTLVRRCGRPILAIAERWSPLDRALLAFDGSPKAREALFVAAYLAGCWQALLVVVTVPELGGPAPAALAYAQSYLAARQVEATFVTGTGPVAAAIQDAATAHHSNLIIMGGYGFNPLLEAVLGSTVDQLLRARRWPVLICR